MSDSRYTVSTENPFVLLSDEAMARENFQTVKRKRNNTDQGEVQVSQLINSSTDDKLNFICNELRVIRSGQEQINRNMLTFQQSFRRVNDKLCEVIEVTNKNTHVLKTLAYKSIDLEARSRRNNLVFWGLIENYHENCFDKIRDLIQRHLDINAGEMYMARAHRLGPRKIGQRNPKRPIIVNFRDFCDTELIMSRAHMLKNTPFSVAYDLPKEINEARKKLWDELRSIKRKDPRVKFQILYPAKLIVNGKLVRDEFPDWGEVLHRSRTTEFAHIDQHSSFDQSNITSSACDWQTRDHLFTNTILESSLGARDSLNIHQERVDVAESIISDRSSYAHGIDEDMQTCDTQTACDPLTAETNVDLPSESDASVIIHRAEIHATNSAQSVSSSQEIFRPYNMDDTITKVHIPEPPQIRVSHERMSRSIERGNRRKPSLSLSESRLKQASRDIKQPKQSNSRSANSKSSHKENVTVPLSRGVGDFSEQRSSAGTSSENSTTEHVNS